MESFDKKKHWEKIYETKDSKEVSWYQKVPITSLEIIEEFNVGKDAKIIDVGGGDSFFVDHLLCLGFKNITVLDLSELAIEKTKQRLGEKAKAVKWLVADASTILLQEKFDFWHDRAAFHFLTDQKDISNYVSNAYKHLNENGHLVIGTFSVDGPTTCSGITIQQYSEESLIKTFQKYLKKIKCFRVDHTTPSNAIQNFVFCVFRK